MNLERFGWSSLRGDAFGAYAADGFVPGRVVSEHRSHFQVVTTAGECSAELVGRLRNEAVLRSDLPAVGDFVALRPALVDGPAQIQALLPRTSALIRKASGNDRPQVLAANIDFVFIVTAPDGDFNPARLDRLLALVGDSGANPVIVLNKADLAVNVPMFTGQIAAIAKSVPLHVISARSREGIGAFESYFGNHQTVGLIGSSGVGKSTLTNMLLGHEAQAIQPVRSHDSRGRHTTTHRQLFARSGGGCIIDTPGMRSIERWKSQSGNADEEGRPGQTHGVSTTAETERNRRGRRRQ